MVSWFFGFAKAVRSSLSTATRAVLLDLVESSSGVDPGAADNDKTGEQSFAQPFFSALGLIARPRPPSTLKDGTPAHLEVGKIKLGDESFPVGYRDLRLNAVYPNPKDGSIALVGYGGGFHSIEDTVADSGDQKSSIQVLYCPYQFSGGVPSKAHVVILDTTHGAESVSIVHGDGMAITMATGGKHSVVIKNKAGDAYAEINDDGITLNGNTVVNGGATLGSPAGAVPVALAPQLVTWLGTLVGAISTGLAGVPVAGGGLASAFGTTMTGAAAVLASVPATKASAL